MRWHRISKVSSASSNPPTLDRSGSAPAMRRGLRADGRASVVAPKRKGMTGDGTRAAASPDACGHIHSRYCVESTALITKGSERYLDECATEVPLNGRRSMSDVIRHEAHRESALARQHRKQRQMEQDGCPLTAG